MREIELKKQVRQLEDKLASAQRQSRLALARAVRAEIETDKVPLLEQKLSQTKTNLEGQIQMKDEARIAAEQQLQQTKAALEHEIHMKDQAERQLNQEKAGLYHEIQVRDQKISSLQQQIYQTEKFLEHHKQAAMSAQQQFSHRVKNLEHQIEVAEQARVTLEMQIQAKDREKAELEHQLHQKEEQIQAKGREKAELEHQLHRKEEHIRAKDREKAKLEHQLHQKEEQIRAKDKEKVELEQQICQIKKHRPPEVTQVVEVQQEGSGYVTAQGAVPSELQYKQSRIETLTADRQERTRQVQTLEAKLEEEKFFQDHYSQEVDQLREELMDKILENDDLRKQLKDVVEADTLPTTSPAGKQFVFGVHQLLQASEEVRKKEEELRQVKEDHQVEVSRIIHETTAKQQKVEFELKAQISTKSEKINTLQSQVNALQHDQDGLQKQLKERDIQIASISSELQHKQNRIETFTADRQELTRQVQTLEAKLEEEKFFRDHYSQEVDQLREELMDKIVENENLTKQQKDVVTADTVPTTCPAGKQFLYSWDYFYELYVVSTIQPFCYSKLTNSFVPRHKKLLGCYLSINEGEVIDG